MSLPHCRTVATTVQQICWTINRLCIVSANRILNSFEFLLRFAVLVSDKGVKGHNETNTIDRVHWFRILLSPRRQN